MDRKWLPLNALRAFEAAGQHLSFTAAANSLTVAQSAVSRHVIVLENFLGVALFERRPQQLVLTEAGRHILPVVSKSFDRIDQALGEVIKEKGRPKRVLKVALPTSFAHRLAIPILRDFRSENSGISLEIVSKPTTGPEVDGDVDIAIVYSSPASLTRFTICSGWCDPHCSAAANCSNRPISAIRRGSSPPTICCTSRLMVGRAISS